MQLGVCFIHCVVGVGVDVGWMCGGCGVSKLLWRDDCVCALWEMLCVYHENCCVHTNGFSMRLWYCVRA